MVGRVRPGEVPTGKITYEEFLAWLDEDTCSQPLF